MLVATTMAAAILAGCGSADRRTGEYLDDQSINARVKTSLLQDDTVSGMDVSTTTYDGVVQLSGFADNQEQQQRAEEVASKVDGVESVINNITINPRATEYGSPDEEDEDDAEAPKAQPRQDPTPDPRR